jgi:hypothetical protein
MSEKSKYHTTKDGRRVKKGLWYYMNKRKKSGTSRSGKGTVSDKAIKKSQKKANKGVKINKKLTERQLKTLERHKEHHTKKHMDMMIKLMQQGKTFTEAHNIAMDKVGK